MVLPHVGLAVIGFDTLFGPFCIWGSELSMNISQVKKLRKIVRIKKLATKNNKIFVFTMKKTSVHYKMVLTIIPCLFIPLPHFQYREDIYAHPCFQAFPKLFTYDCLSNHLYGQEARKVFIQ